MKYLKTYESERSIKNAIRKEMDDSVKNIKSKPNLFYWRVRCDNKYVVKILLKKLKVPNKIINEIISGLQYYKTRYITIGKNYVRWTYNYDIVKIGGYSDKFHKRGFKYMGPIRLTNKEKEELELLIQLDKYNL